MYICIYRDASLSYLLNCSLPTQVIQQQKCERDKKKKKGKDTGLVEFSTTKLI